MTEKASEKNPVPCLHCQGSGLVAKGCNLFQCPECLGTGLRGEKGGVEGGTQDEIVTK